MSIPNCDNIERWDEREMSRLAAITRLLDNPAPDPLFDNPLPEIDEDLDARKSIRFRAPSKREAVSHG